MRSLTLEIPQALQLEINGYIFDVQKSDADILNKCVEFQGKYADLKKSDIADIRDAVNSVVAYIDEILGEGAVLKISGGKSISISCAVAWLTAVCKEIARHNDQYICDKYEVI